MHSPCLSVIQKLSESLKMMSRASPNLSKGEEQHTSLACRKLCKLIGAFENGDQSYKDDVVDVKFGFALQHRSFSMGEREGDRGRCGSYEVD